MKRLLYYIITAAVTLTGCTTWDDPVTENYGAGPSIEVSVKTAAPTDSAFTSNAEIRALQVSLILSIKLDNFSFD